MDEIFSNKPPDAQLESTDIQIKTYILLLERKLKNYISINNLNKEIERKYLNIQDELSAIKLQRKENSQHDELQSEELQKLLSENAALNMENKQLKQQIIMLTKELQQLENNNNSITSKTKKIHQPQPNNVADNNNDPNANSVLVKGFTERELNAIPKINIINLGRRMNLKVLDKDIIKVTKMERKYYERHNLKPNKIILIVQLRTPELKVEFLKNKEKLKSHSSLDDIEIIDYVSDEVYNLYQYAKILKTSGYALIYWRNNCVYAKKTRSTLCEPILIKSKNDVDSLRVVMKK